MTDACVVEPFGGKAYYDKLVLMTYQCQLSTRPKIAMRLLISTPPWMKMKAYEDERRPNITNTSFDVSCQASFHFCSILVHELAGSPCSISCQCTHLKFYIEEQRGSYDCHTSSSPPDDGSRYQSEHAMSQKWTVELPESMYARCRDEQVVDVGNERSNEPFSPRMGIKPA